MRMQKKSKKSVFKMTPELNRAYKALFGAADVSSCCKCGCDSVDELGIYPHDGSGHEWQVLCFRCQNHDKIDQLNSVTFLNFQGGAE